METEKNIGIALLGDTEIDEVIVFYNSVYKTDRTRDKFLWEFFEAPAGKAIYVVAKDLDTQKIVGTQCAIPIALLCEDGGTVLSAKSEDTLVDPAYRGLRIFERMYQLLFEECEKAGIHYLWGFTSARKPFERIGFDIPFSHRQSLIVFDVSGSYTYLSGLSRGNTVTARAKILGLCVMSRLKNLLSVVKSGRGRIRDFSCVVNGELDVDGGGALLKDAGFQGFIIQQDASFLKWRVVDNPYYEEVFNIAFSWNSKMVGQCIFNHLGNGVWFLVSDLYSREVTEDQKTAMFTRSVRELVAQNTYPVNLIRSWNFSHNEYGRKEIALRKQCGFVHLNRGIGFVWKALAESKELDPREFILSRIASQGVM